MTEYGAITGPDTVRMERVLPGPIERVWAFLTEPDKRAKWLAGGAMELRVGGRVELQFLHADLSHEKTPPERYKKMAGGHTLNGKITSCDPPHLLAFTWGEGDPPSEVTFELSERGNQVMLVVTHRRLAARKDMISVAGGWHAHLGILTDVLEGREPRPFWTTHAAVATEYEKRFAE
jgi:uncharacterized protein YndB with AHSA1/START domain